ncbi:apolipoprotein N-acyltransferase [Hydrogenivirga sp.]
MPDKRLKEIALALTFGCLFYLAFSKLNLWFSIFPALFILGLLRTPSAWLMAGYSALLPSLLWVRIAMVDYGEVLPPVAYTLILLLVSFLVLVQFGAVYYLWRRLRYNPIALPFLWVGAELLRSHFPYGGFPWLLVGEISVDVPLLKHYLTAGGVYLCSLLILTLSIAPAHRKNGRFLLTTLALFLLPLPFLKLGYESPRGVKVAVVQPNVEEGVKLNREKFYNYLPEYWKLLDEVYKHKPDVVFLPESALPFAANRLYSEGKRLLSYSERFTIVTGLIDIRFGEGWEPYNSVFVIDRGKVTDFYDKTRLLPFGEYVPFPFGFVKEIFGAIGGTDYVPGDGARCLRAGKLRVGTPVCFEVSYYPLVREFSGCADIIAVLTNDGWFRDSDGTYQHLRQARVRAVENRKFVLWVNNTGPSAVVSPEGELVKSIPYGEKGFILYSFQE